MASVRKTNKKITSKTTKKNIKKSGVFSRFFLIFPVLAVVIIAAFIFQPWKQMGLDLPFMAKSVAVVKPNPDMARARQLTIDPDKNNVMQIVTRENVRVTLDVPKGAISQKTTVKLIPFYYEEKNESPTAGVIVGPASVNFTKPVTLSFNFSDSKFKNNAPKKITLDSLRTNGDSQVLQIDSKATTYTPTLVSRGLETETYLPSRILTGGAYVFSLDGANKSANAKTALDAKKNHSLIVIESASSLLFNNEKLTEDQTKKAKAAIGKILSKKSPPPAELYAALVLQKKMKNPSFSLVPIAYAFETGEGFFQAVCRSDEYSVEQYLGFAQTAQLMGHDNIGESCLNKAKNKIEKQAQDVLNNPNADVKDIIIALKDVQIIGLDDETNLDERLHEKAKERAVEDAKKVSEDPDASPIDAAKQLQKLEALGVEEGPTYEKLQDKVKDETTKYDDAIEDPNDSDGTIVEEEVLNNAMLSALGIAMAKAFGFEELDEASLKAKFDEMTEKTQALNEAVYAACLELGGDDCEKNYSEAAAGLEQAQSDGYRVADEIGDLQSQDYEEPDYEENQGDIEMYFEEELTPTPEEGEGEYYEEEQNDSYDSEDGSYDDSYGQQDDSYVEYESAPDESYDAGDEGSSDEDVQGASTKRSERFKPFSWWSFH